MKRILFMTGMLGILLAACAPAAAPTIDPAQIQASAVAAANTMVAQTQAAMPTDTPVPPTPLPTATTMPLPTLPPLLATIPVLPSPTTVSSGGGTGSCNQPLDVAAAGAKAPVLIRNDTNGSINFSMGLSSKNSFGQCGYMSWGNIPKANSITVSVPMNRTNQGDPCYWAYAWINDPKKPTTVSGNQAYCINNGDKWTFDVGYDRIKLTPP
ncbi:MAG TPA: hypothetical protein VF784_07920 [Anaerolineales bacterium]